MLEVAKKWPKGPFLSYCPRALKSIEPALGEPLLVAVRQRGLVLQKVGYALDGTRNWGRWRSPARCATMRAASFVISAFSGRRPSLHQSESISFWILGLEGRSSFRGRSTRSPTGVGVLRRQRRPWRRREPAPQAR